MELILFNNTLYDKIRVLPLFTKMAHQTFYDLIIIKKYSHKVIIHTDRTEIFAI